MFSRLLYNALDHLGYNDDIIKFRRESWRYWATLQKTSKQDDFHSVLAGSKAEGITSMRESDLDIFYFVDEGMWMGTLDQLPRQLSRDVIVFLADMENVPPGYTRLQLYQPSSFRNVRNRDILACLIESDNGRCYLSSTFWVDRAKSTFDSPDSDGSAIQNVITGPALQTNAAEQDIDCVLGLSIHCPQLLQAWSSRTRHHEWPSRDIIQTACSFLPQVVPVGAKGSDRQFQEWRFCFIESELTLTQNLNGTQIKLYILLKMIAKNVLKAITSEISSYIMKNITYWLSELLPLHMFTEEKLVPLVLLALTFLRTAITRWQNLPYYMIPARNLLSERLNEHTSRELSDVLAGLLQEGPRLFLRVDKLRRCLSVACQMPNYMVQYGNMRDQVEKNQFAIQVLDALRELNVRLDYSIQAKLENSQNSLVVPHLHLLDPSRHGVFSTDEIEQAILSILS